MPQDEKSRRSLNDQASTQQQMNSDAQRQAATPPGQRTTTVNGKEVPFYPAAPGHASASLYRLNQLARLQEKNGDDPGVPDSALPESLLSARLVHMPPGGIQALASSLYPDDTDNNDAMDQHIQDILNLNRDTLRDDTAHPVNAIVRVPAA